MENSLGVFHNDYFYLLQSETGGDSSWQFTIRIWFVNVKPMKVWVLWSPEVSHFQVSPHSTSSNLLKLPLKYSYSYGSSSFCFRYTHLDCVSLYSSVSPDFRGAICPVMSVLSWIHEKYWFLAFSSLFVVVSMEAAILSSFHVQSWIQKPRKPPLLNNCLPLGFPFSFLWSCLKWHLGIWEKGYM